MHTMTCHQSSERVQHLHLYALAKNRHFYQVFFLKQSSARFHSRPAYCMVPTKGKGLGLLEKKADEEGNWYTQSLSSSSVMKATQQISSFFPPKVKRKPRVWIMMTTR